MVVELKKSDLSVAYIDTDDGAMADPTLGLKMAMGRHFECVNFHADETRRWGNKSSYYRLMHTFIDWWFKNFMEVDYDVYVFTHFCRSQDLRMSQHECWNKIPMVYVQHASGTLWGDGFPDHRRRDIDEFQNYFFADKALSYSQFQVDRICEFAGRYFIPEKVQEIRDKFDIVPLALDWGNRFKSEKAFKIGDKLQFFGSKQPDWLPDHDWNPRVDEVPLEVHRAVENRPPIIIFNSRLDTSKDVWKLSKVFEQLVKRGQDFRVIFSLPSTTNFSNMKGFFEKLFNEFIDKFIAIAIDPPWEVYNLFLNTADYFVGTNNDEHFCVSMHDAWKQGVMPVVPDCQIYRELLVDSMHDAHLFDDYNASHAVDKIMAFEKNREKWRAQMPQSEILIPIEPAGEFYLKYFDDLYADFWKEVGPPKDGGAIGKMMEWIREAPVSKKELHRKLGWAKPIGWSVYRNKLHKMGVRSMKTRQGMMYYLPEFEEEVAAEAVREVRRKGLF